MALKPDRIETQTDVSFFSDATATRGGVASVKTAGSGVSMDDSSAVVEYTAALANANPVGILLMISLILILQDSISIIIRTKSKRVAKLLCYSLVKSPQVTLTVQFHLQVPAHMFTTTVTFQLLAVVPELVHS